MIVARGTDPVSPRERLYLDVDAIPADVVSACPAGHEDGAQVANATGGLVITLANPEGYDAAGNFSMPIGVTPGRTGTFLLCGYTDDGATDTLAVSQLTVAVRAAGTSGGLPPQASQQERGDLQEGHRPLRQARRKAQGRLHHQSQACPRSGPVRKGARQPG